MQQKKKSCKLTETSLQDCFTYDSLLKWGVPLLKRLMPHDRDSVGKLTLQGSLYCG